jgi:hypothetical protein
MKTLQIPKFKKSDKYKFIGFKKVKVKNKMNSKDYIKVVSELPGMAVGYCAELYNILESKKPIEITRFYDVRQSPQFLKGHFITVV